MYAYKLNQKNRLQLSRILYTFKDQWTPFVEIFKDFRDFCGHIKHVICKQSSQYPEFVALVIYYYCIFSKTSLTM